MAEQLDDHTSTRRDVLLAGAGLGAIGFGSGRAWGTPSPAAARIVPLPSAATIGRDYQHMVDFGPRLPGHPNHIRFVEWMAKEFEQIGLTLGPCDSYAYKRWDPLDFGLAVEDGTSFRAIPKMSHYVRSEPTSADGVTGRLVYGGDITAKGPAADLGDIPRGSIVVFDGKLPVPTIRELVDPLYVHVPEAETEAYLASPYKRLWLTPHFPLEAVLAKGAAGVVIIMDVSSDMIAGNFSPHASHYKPPLPALFCGQDTGAELRTLAKAGKRARLTLSAKWVDCAVPSLTAILPGESDEVLVIDTHTDGQNFIEENGCMALVQLARHFASLPKKSRLRRTLVFVGWSGHMSGALPECPGWVRAHPDLVKRAAAAFTIEHLGAPEWEDVPGKGYAATGRNEYMNFATTGGIMTELVKAGFRKYDLREHGIQRGPGTTTGSVFHDNGVPHVGVICGPNYLLGIVTNGHIDKLDAELASRQTAMIAEMIRTVDGVPAKELRAIDRVWARSPSPGRTSVSARHA